jgi:DNA-binding IclR family transcriptional regulator
VLPALTGHTVTSGARLTAELAAVRRSGVAYDVEESHLGLFCVGAPIRDLRGVAVAAVSVTGATELAQAERFSTTVVAAARAIEHRLSGRVPRSQSAPHTRA